MNDKQTQIIDESGDKYKYGFVTDIAADTAPKGLNADIIRLISAKKGEPEWLLDWRLKAFEFWQTMTEPTWAKLVYDKIDYQDLYYYSAPVQKAAPKSLDEVDPELLDTYAKLGIPLKEQEALAGVVAVDAVFDSVSVATTYRAKLAEQGIIFCSISEAVKEHPELVQKYLGSVVPYTDNFFACLPQAVCPFPVCIVRAEPAVKRGGALKICRKGTKGALRLTSCALQGLTTPAVKVYNFL